MFRPILIPFLMATVLTANQIQAAEIRKISIGRHDNFTRLVVRLDDASNYSVDELNSNHVRLLLGDVSAAGPATEIGPDDRPLSSLSYQATDAGLQLDIQFDGVASIKSFALPPEGVSGHRVVLDFFHSKTAANKTAKAAEPSVPKEPPAEKPEYVAVAIEPPSTPDPEPEFETDLRPTGSIPIQTDPCAKTSRQLELDSWDLLALVNHGVCLEENGNLFEARSTFERVLTFDPSIHGARLGLASVLKKMNRPQAAREAYKYVLDSNPPPEVARMIETAISELDQRGLE